VEGFTWGLYDPFYSHRFAKYKKISYSNPSDFTKDKLKY